MPGIDDYDHRAPLGDEQDMRTSSYLGHRYKRLQNTDFYPNLRKQDCPVQLKSMAIDPVIKNAMKSEMKTHYIWQYDKNRELRNPSLSMKMQFMKPYADVKLNFIKRNIRPPTSVSHEDYVKIPLVPPEPLPPRISPLPSVINTTKIVIDYAKEGYAKYLDPSATTNRLTYPHYSPTEIQSGIANHDNITFYNWHKHYNPLKRVAADTDETICDNYPSNQCVKRKNEYPSQIKFVPYNGLTTETQSNYLHPKYHPERLDSADSYKNCVIQIEPTTMARQTEAMIIGSGDHVERFV